MLLICCWYAADMLHSGCCPEANWRYAADLLLICCCWYAQWLLSEANWRYAEDMLLICCWRYAQWLLSEANWRYAEDMLLICCWRYAQWLLPEANWKSAACKVTLQRWWWSTNSSLSHGTPLPLWSGQTLATCWSFVSWRLIAHKTQRINLRALSRPIVDSDKSCDKQLVGRWFDVLSLTLCSDGDLIFLHVPMSSSKLRVTGGRAATCRSSWWLNLKGSGARKYMLMLDSGLCTWAVWKSNDKQN